MFRHTSFRITNVLEKTNVEIRPPIKLIVIIIWIIAFT